MISLNVFVFFCSVFFVGGRLHVKHHFDDIFVFLKQKLKLGELLGEVVTNLAKREGWVFGIEGWRNEAPIR